MAAHSRLLVDEVDVLVEGDGAETIVMIHGWPDTYRLWDAQAAFFKDRYRCVRFTLPGFDIDKPRRAYSIAELVAIVKNVVERASSGRKVILMLHDWGCVFGYEFAMRHPELVSRIVGVDIGDAGSRAHLRALRARDKAMIFAYQVWLAIAWMIGGAPGRWMTRWMARAIRCPSDPRFIDSRMDYPYYNTWFKSQAHDMVRFEPSWPVLFIYGSRKPFMFHSPSWAKALPLRQGSETQAFDTGHWVMSQQPERFNQVVAAWLGSGRSG